MTEPNMQISEYGFRAIFEGAPVSIWDEDFSQVKRIVDRIFQSGVTDIVRHFRETPEAVLECVQAVRVRHVNRAARLFYGAESEQELIEALPRLFDPTALDIFREEISALATGANTFEAELSVRTLSGEPRRVVMNVSMLGEPIPDWSKVVVAFTDITDRRRLEQSLRKANKALVRMNKHLEQFAYAAAHDMREPLRTIALYTQLLRRDQPADPGTRADMALTNILKHARRMETLVSDLLTFAKVVERSHTDGLACDTDAHAVLEDVLSSLSGAVQETGTQIYVSDRLPPTGMEALHLRQVLHNLLSNAIKYRAADRTPSISITAERGAAVTTFCVADNGLGIRGEYHERIFGIFKRLHGQEIEGNGIGLALCKNIVEDYGGRIWVESAPDVGSRFYFTVPCGPDAA